MQVFRRDMREAVHHGEVSKKEMETLLKKTGGRQAG